MKKLFVLHSGGLDSTAVLLHLMNSRSLNASDVVSLGISYGQRHGSREFEAAENICQLLGVERRIIDIQTVMPQVGMLTDTSKEIPNKSYAELDPGISPTYVPFRNGLMISILASIAMGEVMKEVGSADGIKPSDWQGKEKIIAFGAHADDAANWAYPDCTPEFFGAMSNAVFLGSYQTTRLEAPFISVLKSEIVSKAMQAGFQVTLDYKVTQRILGLTWSCYKGEEKQCGLCPTCLSRKEAFMMANVEDHTEYSA